MDEWQQPRERAEWTHPRRAAKETISYLSQVEPAIDQFAQDDHSYGGGGDGDEDDDEDVGREQMMDNILEELKHQTASIMEDRQGSVVAEKIARRLTPLQLRIMLSRCRGYMLSLANNRYSSHVLQTLLSLAGPVVEAEISEDGDGDGAYGGEDVAATVGDEKKIDCMQDIVLSLVSELTGAWAELLADISGSHVGRGFLQVLGGLPILSEKRGRQSRHAHSIGTAVAPGRTAVPSAGDNPRAAAAAKGATSASPVVDPEALGKWCTPYKHRVPPSFVAALGEVTSELVALPAGELQRLACGTFGCPLLVMLLRVHANLTTTVAARVTGGKGDDDVGVSRAEGAMMVLPCLEQESAAMRIVTKVLEWGDEERSEQVVYAIAGENTASHFLEAVLWLSPRQFFEEIYRRCFERKLLEFCEHSVSNFLIQAALQRADDKVLAERMVEAISSNSSELLKARRAGVLWRAAQACVRLGLKPETQAKLLQDISFAVQSGHTGAAPLPSTIATATNADSGTAEDCKREDGKSPSPPSGADAFKAARKWIPALLSPRLPGERGLDRLFLNVPGARIVQNILLFDPPVAAPVLRAVAALPEDVLAAVARDNMGSRCLLDPILEAAGASRGGGGRGRNKPAEDARRAILRVFRGHLVAMACDRVAWHILLKCFRGVDMKGKRAMVEELAGGGEQAWSRMSGYPSGRTVLTECMVERFSRSPLEWENAFKNRETRDKMLAEILAVEPSSSSAKQAAASRGRADKGRGSGKAGAANGGKDRAVGLALSPFNSTTGQEADGGRREGEDSEKGKEKRRRQRGRGKRGKSSGGSGEAATAEAADADVDGGGVDATAEDGGDPPAPEGGVSAAHANKGVKNPPKQRSRSGVKADKVEYTDTDASKKRKAKYMAQEGVAVGGVRAEGPKKIKRRRQGNGNQLDGIDGGGGAAAIGDAAAGAKKDREVDPDLPVAVTIPAVSLASEEQATTPAAAVKKKRQKKGASGDEVGVNRSGPEHIGDEGKGMALVEKKRKSKEKAPVDDGSKWKAVATPSERKEGQREATAAKEPKAAGGSAKKRKGGFRLF